MKHRLSDDGPAKSGNDNGSDCRRQQHCAPDQTEILANSPSADILEILYSQSDVAGKQEAAPSNGPNLNLLINADSIAKLTERLDAAHSRYGLSTSHLESQVRERTRSLEHITRRLELIIDSISDGLVTVGPDGLIESINRSACELFEISEIDALGQDIHLVLGVDPTELVLDKGTVEMSVSLKSGRQIRIELEPRQIDAINGGTVLLSIRDLTCARHTQKRLNEYAFLVENVQAFVLISSPENCVEWCNPHFEELTGYSRTELIGKQLPDYLVDAGTPSESRETLDLALFNKEYYNVQLLVHHKSGRLIWTQVEGHPMFSDDGRFEKFVAMGIDITDRKLREQMQVDFCSMVSHELRTPLTVVSGCLDAMIAGLTGAMSSAASELLDMGQRNCSQLAVLIEDILDINKLESGVTRFQSEFISLSDPLRDAIASAVPLCNTAGRRLNVDDFPDSALVFGDPQRLRQVFTNLLSNAIKFSFPGSTIHVGVKQTGNQLRAYVRDEGHGVPVQFRPYIFQKFSRDASVQASGKEGFGLGLSICKGLIEQMGGQINYETELGVGTTFFIDLPIFHNELRGVPGNRVVETQ